jgi:ubiquinone/menaquinone biosynthesis C-methylase UbiE
LENTDRDWKVWGDKEPYFGVLTDNIFRSGSLEANRRLFMELGEEYVNAHLQEIEQHFGPIKSERALDFGCGVGRLALPLADRFENVVGLDISEGMLREAAANADASGRGNVDFLLSDDQLSKADGIFDFVHTYIVLQHIPVARGMKIINELLNRTAIEGVASLHFSTERKTGWLLSLLYWVRHSVPGFNFLVNKLRGKNSWEPVMQMNEYSLSSVLEAIKRAGFTKPVIALEAHGYCQTVQIFAKKVANGATVST